MFVTPTKTPSPPPCSTPTNVAILGGGLSGLVAAYELTRTPELRARFSVTLYQMGWRLGGKLASGRNANAANRNEEHGLHVWFGFYENAFRLARELYANWAPPADCPVTSVEDFIRPQVFTPIGDRHDGEVAVWPACFGANRATPGTGTVGTSGRDFLGAGLGLVVTLLRTYGLGPGARGEANHPDRKPTHGRADRLLDAVTSTLKTAASKSLQGRHPRAVAARRVVYRALSSLLRAIRSRTRRRSVHHLTCCLEFLVAMLRGMFDPRWSLLADGDLDAINHLDFRDWLVECGASREVADTWPGIAALYDSTFQFIDGDRQRPAFEAGTALRFFIRAYFTYKGGVLYLLEVGMGEGLIAPLYEVLRERGVNVEFFHELTHVCVRGDEVASLRFHRQATTRNGGSYDPLFTLDGLRCWPSHPLWDQLADTPCANPSARFEANRGERQAGSTVEKLHGKDFDEVILALPAGALSERTGPSPISDVLDHTPALRTCLNAINLVPSVAAQLWLDRDLDELGWRWPRPAMVGWAHPYDVWADMTPVLRHESWPGPNAPKTAHYLCGAFGTTAHLSDDPKAFAQARDIAQSALADQLARHGPTLWPATGIAGDFDWCILHDPKNRVGPARLDAQYVRANVAPSDLCDCAAPNTAHLRPEAHDSGLSNLVLCGTWVNNPVNSSCVEAATMAGLAAARVLTGSERALIGEHFMRRAVPPRIRLRRQPPTRKPAPIYTPASAVEEVGA